MLVAIKLVITTIGKAEPILKKTGNLLGEDDPVSDKFETLMMVFHNTHRSIRSFIEKGEIIEDFLA